MTSFQSLLNTEVSASDARSLAAKQGDLRRDPRFLTHFSKAKPVSRMLVRAQKWLTAITNGDAQLQSATESFLDNFYFIRRVARQVEEELPRGFVRHLPQLASGVDKGTPRVEALARALVAQGGLTLSFASLRQFVNAYQEVTRTSQRTVGRRSRPAFVAVRRTPTQASCSPLRGCKSRNV